MSVREFIGEWEARLDRAVEAGCRYSDAVLAFKLLERANLEKAELELGMQPGMRRLLICWIAGSSRIRRAASELRCITSFQSNMFDKISRYLSCVISS